MSEASEDAAANAGPPRANVDDDGLEISLDRFQQAVLGNLNTLFDRIDREALEQAVQALANARRVYVIGTQPAHSFALHLHHVASRRFPNWRLVEWRSGARSSAWGTLTDKDVVVGLAAEPYATSAIAFARDAQAVGARVVGITDRPMSPLADCADDVLLFPVRSPGDFPFFVGVTALVAVLVGMVAARNGGLHATPQA